MPFAFIVISDIGNYDTYKGSTQLEPKETKFLLCIGNYDTYKGSTQQPALHIHRLHSWKL